jgi:hypothetical protein
MIANDPYIAALHRLGEFDAALAAAQDPEVTAELLVDRFFWQGQDHDAAQSAVDGLDPDSVAALYLSARMAYSRILFEYQERPDDRAVAEAGFQAVAADPHLGGWGEFHLGVYADNVREDPAAAKEHYAKAAATADPLLESYVVRHMSVHEPDRAIEHLRRSLYLRATLGYRPQTAAAMAALAGELPDGPERTHLQEAALLTAQELGLTWLIGSLT